MEIVRVEDRVLLDLTLAEARSIFIALGRYDTGAEHRELASRGWDHRPCTDALYVQLNGEVE